ncbi:MAG: hypothetical protein VKJ46_13295 [Leptolyngbyaceae bacterium]|nr:hypothetical protein [Leptolyngbyaceae bacterium]
MKLNLRNLLKLGVGGWICWNFLALPGQAQPAPNPPCSPLTKEFNTTRQGNAILLGRPPNYRFVVIIPTRNPEKVNVVRQCVSDAFFTESSLGSYIQAGAFPDRASAESLSWFLRSRGLDARVVYF